MKTAGFHDVAKEDIANLHAIRMAVTENVLSDPGKITVKDYEKILEQGKGWLCRIDYKVAGFAMVDMKNKNIWALFVHPEMERKGIGKRLFTMMVDWAFAQGIDKLWLTTAPNTKAERIYAGMGWKKTGEEKTGEIRFECTREEWQQFSLKLYQY